MKKTISILLFSIAAGIIIPNTAFSQVYIKGRVIYQKDKTPAALATIGLANHTKGTVSDKGGNFYFHISKINFADTLLVSSMGYETLKIPVLTALNKTEYILFEKIRTLEPVLVKSFSSSQVLGPNSEGVDYYRSWNFQNTGGQIGRIFEVPYKEYKIDKIRFKASNFCDTCLIRVHIWNVVDDQPDVEIFGDSVSVLVNKLTLQSKASEFDLTPYDHTFTQDKLFVSMEVLNCRNKQNEFCSFCFVGTEKGEYIFKSNSREDWRTTDDYTIYMKLFVRY